MTVTRYYKATQPDGRDFHTGTIDYAAALPSPPAGSPGLAADMGATKFMCEHCTSPGEYHVHTDRPHWLCDDCLDTLAAHHDWQAAA